MRAKRSTQHLKFFLYNRWGFFRNSAGKGGAFPIAGNDNGNDRCKFKQKSFFLYTVSFSRKIGTQTR